MGGFASIGVPGLIILLVIVLVLFGPRKLPEVGSAVGKTLAEFKKSTRDIMDDEESPAQKDPKKKELS
ncbi:twin-arginine translocase TatA/TatE family subunit [Sporosarcina sp. FSL W7-1349]|uniref:twin-arginine translocase TatA/TatE family subunit n=1 Tax=Sporosarcina sp. FSL W7-1349 TaxID=2921561 RepID=UPI0030FD0C75